MFSKKIILSLFFSFSMLGCVERSEVIYILLGQQEDMVPLDQGASLDMELKDQGPNLDQRDRRELPDAKSKDQGLRPDIAQLDMVREDQMQSEDAYEPRDTIHSIDQGPSLCTLSATLPCFLGASDE